MMIKKPAQQKNDESEDDEEVKESCFIEETGKAKNEEYDKESSIEEKEDVDLKN